MTQSMTRDMADAIIAAIEAGIRSGADVTDWEAPEYAEAVRLTGEAGCVWDFSDWRETRDALAYTGQLGGVFVVVPGPSIDAAELAAADEED